MTPLLQVFNGVCYCCQELLTFTTLPNFTFSKVDSSYDFIVNILAKKIRRSLRQRHLCCALPFFWLDLWLSLNRVLTYLKRFKPFNVWKNISSLRLWERWHTSHKEGCCRRFLPLSFLKNVFWSTKTILKYLRSYTWYVLFELSLIFKIDTRFEGHPRCFLFLSLWSPSTGALACSPWSSFFKESKPVLVVFSIGKLTTNFPCLS